MISILYELDSINNTSCPLLNTLFESAVFTPTFDPSKLFPKHSYIEGTLYKGSSTTPPCSENITWLVTTKKASQWQIDYIDNFYSFTHDGNHTRETQEIGERVLNKVVAPVR